MINLLLIDDDEEEYFIFSDAIRVFPEPMRCIYAQNADESFRILQNVKPDIIFVNMNMPKINGLEYIKDIKSMHKIDVPLIVLYSTYINAETVYAAKMAGAVDCLQKASSKKTLIDMLSPYLNLLVSKN